MNSFRHLILYGASALTGFVLDLSLWLTITHFWNHPLIAQTCSKSVAACVGYILYRNVFKNTTTPFHHFALSVAFAWAVSLVLLTTYSHFMPEISAKIATDITVFLMNYGIMKKIVFRN